MKAKIKTRIQLENRESLADNIPLNTPWVIFVDPCDWCNFRCRFCPSGDKSLLNDVGRPQTFMKFDLFKKIVDDICEFEKPIKVLRLYLHGEPLANPRFADMVKYAKLSGCCNTVDTTTNGSLLNPKTSLDIVEAGLDRINISIEGVNGDQYLEFANKRINFDRLVNNIKYLYENRKQLEIFIKINGDFLYEEEKDKFFEIFGDICDGIAIEHTMNCWYNFDGPPQNEEVGIYGQPIHEVEVCPYVFYQMSINSDGIVSACFIDWARELQIGDVNKQSVKEIWNGDEMRFYQEFHINKLRKTHEICGNCSQLSHGMPVDLDFQAKEIYKRWLK